MGCDFWYSGFLPDEELQEKVVDFARSYFSEDATIVHPQAGMKFPTLINEGFEDEKFEPSYPFNFFGIIPVCRSWLVERSQFVFDRTAGGQLITLLSFPSSLAIYPEDVCTNVKSEIQCNIKKNGYTRLIEGRSAFSLLLNIIRLRWWPDFSLGDDFMVVEAVENLLVEYGMLEIMKNEELDFLKCWDLYIEENERRNPLPPPKPAIPSETGVKKVDLKILDEPLSNIELSLRSSICFTKEGIVTLRQLLNYSPKDLLRIRNFGRKSLFEVESTLRELGLCLREEK